MGERMVDDLFKFASRSPGAWQHRCACSDCCAPLPPIAAQMWQMQHLSSTNMDYCYRSVDRMTLLTVPCRQPALSSGASQVLSGLQATHARRLNRALNFSHARDHALHVHAFKCKT